MARRPICELGDEEIHELAGALDLAGVYEVVISEEVRAPIVGRAVAEREQPLDLVWLPCLGAFAAQQGRSQCQRQQAALRAGPGAQQVQQLGAVARVAPPLDR